MKKIFLLVVIICATQNVHAQGFQYFDHGRAIEEMSGGVIQSHLIPLWSDSTVREMDGMNAVPIKYLSALQVIDPYISTFG